MMKIFRKIFSVLAMAAMLCATMSSCDKEDGMDKYYNLFQQYCVIVADDGVAAFANFRLGGENGERVELTNGTNLTVNTLQAYYQESLSATDPEYNYSVLLDRNHKKAIFRFFRSKKLTIVNELGFDSIPTIDPPAINEYVEGSAIKLNLKGMLPSRVHCFFQQQGSTVTGKQYPGTVSPTGEVIFKDIPSGLYSLTIETSAVYPTKENDGTAGGSMQLIKRTGRHSIRVIPGNQ